MASITTTMIDITPTPEGFRRMHRVFEAETNQARDNARAATRAQAHINEALERDGRLRLTDDLTTVLLAALEHYAEAEETRAAHLAEAAEDCARALAGPTTLVEEG